MHVPARPYYTALLIASWTVPTMMTGQTDQTQGTCYACGQSVTGSLIYERGEILQVSRNAAEAEVVKLKSEDGMNEKMLARIRAKADLRRRVVHAWMEVAKARERVGESEAKLKARREDLG